jgi:lipopolysaccharide/colanic/teichoic acid biosynthesis glycosyltransferase
MRTWLGIRRPLDLVAATVLVVPLAPLLIAIALWVRFHDGSPVLVRLPRVGRGGIIFHMFKFRTMTASSPYGLASGLRITSGSDQRITRSGHFLRKHRMDELPQLLNVFRGEIGLLGPRPETPEFVDVTNRDWQKALSIRPGIAGLTQLLVADIEPFVLDTDSPEEMYSTKLLPLKLKLDCCYVAHACFTLDLKIVFALCKRVAGKGREDALLGWLDLNCRDLSPALRALRSGHPYPKLPED